MHLTPTVHAPSLFDAALAGSAFAPSFPSLADVEAVTAQLRAHRSLTLRSTVARDGAASAGVVWQVSVSPGVIKVGTVDWGARERREALDGSHAISHGDRAKSLSSAPAGAEFDTSSADFDGCACDVSHGTDIDCRRVGAYALLGLRPDETRDQAIARFERTFSAESTFDYFEDDDRQERRRVRSWSRKSRANMRRQLANLDYSGMYVGGHAPALVTLTLPMRWQDCAPTGPDFKRLMRKFRRRYERAYWKIQAVWKMEFQARGAPHLHLQMVPPTAAPIGWHPPANPAGVGPYAPRCIETVTTPYAPCRHTFLEWIGHTWPEVCLPEDADVRAAYLLDGEHRRHVAVTSHPTTVDVREGMRYTDPKRLATYFAKHGAFSAKEYQHEVPAEWEDGCGRFWGYWGLDNIARSTEVRPDAALAIARTLRRMSRQAHRSYKRCTGAMVRRRRLDGQWHDDCETHPGHDAGHSELPTYVEKRVWRHQGVDTTTGVLPDRHDDEGVVIGSKGQFRKVKKRISRMASSRGFVLVNDAPAVAAELAYYLAQRDALQSGQKAPRRGSMSVVDAEPAARPRTGVLW